MCVAKELYPADNKMITKRLRARRDGDIIISSAVERLCVTNVDNTMVNDNCFFTTAEGRQAEMLSLHYAEQLILGNSHG